MFAVLQTLSGADLTPAMLMRSRALPKMARIARPECRGGGMADAEDSKSSVRKHVRVQVPPSAPELPRDYAGYSANAHPLPSGCRANLASTWPVLGNRFREALDLRGG